jgi:hypothetical protein
MDIKDMVDHDRWGNGEITTDQLRANRDSRARAGMIGIAVVATVYTAGRVGPGLFLWTVSNPQTATGVAIGIITAISGYEGPDIPGPGDDLGKLGRKGYEALVKGGSKSGDELGIFARNAYNKIIGTIDDEIRGVKTLEGRAQKAFDIRNQAKDFARELSGPELKKAAEARSLKDYGNTGGPSFTNLYKKYFDQAAKSGLKGDAAKNRAYNLIIEAAKRPDEALNKRFGVQK